VSYVVSWKQSDGEPGWHQADDVQEATAFVEHLRNGSGVEAASIYKLEEVAFEFRPYFRVELSTSEPVAPSAAVDDPAPIWAVPATVEDGATVRRGLFGR
jgi:hypothetical protein